MFTDIRLAGRDAHSVPAALLGAGSASAQNAQQNPQDKRAPETTGSAIPPGVPPRRSATVSRAASDIPADTQPTATEQQQLQRDTRAGHKALDLPRLLDTSWRVARPLRGRNRWRKRSSPPPVALVGNVAKRPNAQRELIMKLGRLRCAGLGPHCLAAGVSMAMAQSSTTPGTSNSPAAQCETRQVLGQTPATASWTSRRRRKSKPQAAARGVRAAWSSGSLSTAARRALPNRPRPRRGLTEGGRPAELLSRGWLSLEPVSSPARALGLWRVSFELTGGLLRPMRP